MTAMNQPSAMQIGRRRAGDGCPVFIVMEVAQAHDGSLGTAHALIDVAARAGADAVKFQTHIAAAESTARECFRVAFSLQDKTRYAYWKRMEFTEEQWQGLADHAAARNLEFLSTPFSMEAVALLERIGMEAWKVGSGEIGNTVMLQRMARTGKPILLSSGMSAWAELDAAVALVKKAGNPLLVYQCCTQYPTPPAQVGLGLLGAIRDRYAVPVGLSDHSGTPCFGIAAAALGAASVEAHVTMSRYSFGPDVPASLTPEEFTDMVEGIRAVEASLRQTPDKDAVASELADLRRMFGKSIVASAAVPCGTVLTEGHLALKKPADGLPPSRMQDVIGRRTKRALHPDEALVEGDLE